MDFDEGFVLTKSYRSVLPYPSFLGLPIDALPIDDLQLFNSHYLYVH